jgi:hypothetical protein
MIELPVNIRSEHVNAQRLDIHYPVVYGLENSEVQRKLNYDILTTVHQLIVKQGYYENPMTEITSTFELKTNEKGVLSLTIENYAYSGGAHGLTIIKGLTFDVKNGKKYSLNELFKPNSSYTTVLSDMVKQQIKERDLLLLGEFKGISPQQDYYIADKVLVLFFQLYELTAYAFGFPYFPISVYDIQTMIDEESPLGKMLS